MPTNCPHCKALATPGAPFCMACFQPFEQPAPVAAPALATVGAPAAPASAGDFFATAPVAAPYVPPPPHTPTTPAFSVKTKVIAAVAALALLALGFAVARMAVHTESEKTRIAKAFRDGRPPDFLPKMPDLNGYAPDRLDEATETPGGAVAYVTAIDPAVRAADTALVSLQGTLLGWAKGSVSDDQLRVAVKATTTALHVATGDDLLVHAPPSVRSGLTTMSSAATDYDTALGALLGWLGGHQAKLRATYRLAVGTANVHWDQGVVAVYRAASLPAPPLPHPSP